MSSDRSGPNASPGARVVPAAAVFLLAALPILLVPFPPATDLPQHVAQVRLFQEALRDPQGPYVIQWLGPNNLGYLVLLALWTVLPPGFMARAALLCVVLSWVAAIHGLGARRGRRPEAAVVASLLLFNQSFTAGFLNFLVGFPVFLLWFGLTADENRRVGAGHWLALAGTSLLLYASHALWLAAGAAWLLVGGVIRKTPLTAIGRRATALLPCALIAVSWYPAFAAARSTAGFDVAARWWPLAERLSLTLPSALFTLRGPVGWLPLAFVILWVALSLWHNRQRFGQTVDRDLLAAALFFLAVGALAPDKYLNTIFFASRWLAPAAILLLLALPAPRLGRLPAQAVALPAVLVFFLATAVTWMRYDAQELSGLAESLEAITPRSRVLGLDRLKESRYIKDRPFLQLFAYAQVLKPATLSFSFAEHASGLVACRQPRRVPWTPGLEWYAERVRATDFGYFDFAIVNAREEDHAALVSQAPLAPLTRTGRWRLYRVIPSP